jgi:NitT/TauT family transport system substrate-binding protein
VTATKEDVMTDRRPQPWNRREFLSSIIGAATTGLSGLHQESAGAESPLETTRLRLADAFAVCVSPMYVVEEFLRGEGFTEVQWIKTEGRLGARRALASGAADVTVQFAGSFITAVDASDPITLLAGIHVGCYELFATEGIRTIRDFKGKSVAVTELGSGRHLFFASLLNYVGLDAAKDVQLVTHSPVESIQLFVDGRVDAYQAFSEEVPELRARKIGRVVLSSARDRPWSQYFCCMVSANRDFVRRNPVATKRGLRALLKATDLCAREPERVARFVVDTGFTKSYDYALQTLKELPYTKWREYKPEDTVRFYALRLHEAGIIKSTPQRIMAQGTDWRFLNELKKELKG